MATKKAIIKGIAAIKTVYSYFGKDTNLELLVDTWTALLQEYTDDEFDRGLFLALKTCKYAPVPADIIEKIEGFRTREKPCETELWAQYRKALKEVLHYSYRLDYNYIDDSGISQGEQAKRKIEEIWSGLPEELKIFVGDKSELISNARALNYSDISFEKNRFSKVFPILQKRVRENVYLENTKRYLLEGSE